MVDAGRHCREERANPAQSTAPGSDAAPQRGDGLRLAALPAFVTPDWLRENHHLMKADLRKLAAGLGEEYPDWPAKADGTDEAAFWRAVHAFAQRWTWFLRLFEERIPQLFGRVKGGRKQLGTRVIKAASDRARELCPVGPGDAEPTILDDLENLWQAGERDRVAQSVWVLSCLEDADSRLIVSPWLMEPEIEDLVGDAVRRARSGWNPERGDLVERLVHEPGGPNLERLAARAEGVCAALEKDIGDAWGRLRKHVSAHDAYHPVAEVLSYLIFDLDSCTDDLEEMETARQEALARCRHCELRSLLEGTLDALPETRFADEADALRGRVATLLEGSGLPLCFPEPEWERCRGLAERFRAGIVEPGEHERALQEASRRYAENPSAANLGALHAAAAAEREQPRSTEPAAALDGIAACLGDLVERFGSLADRDGEEEEIAGREPRDPERALQAEIGELKAANREAGERIAALVQALGDAAEENDDLRREKHRLQQRLAAAEGGEPAPAEDRTLPALASYAELPAWAERHFGGRVSLAGRALRALKGAEFEDVDLVGKAIALLGGTYWRMKTEGGKELRDDFEGALRDLRLLETPSLSRERQGRARDDFSIEWKGRRLTLDRHLKNNVKTRDPRYCFRLYFAWDDAARQVVIGHLPGHMKT